jgi:hypothetical protein
MIGDILGGILIPHLLAFCLLFRIATWEVRADRTNTMREDMARLWAWMHPHWCKMVAHPLYWVGCGIVSAFFLSGVAKRIFL